jgi:hypothetical protein
MNFPDRFDIFKNEQLQSRPVHSRTTWRRNVTAMFRVSLLRAGVQRFTTAGSKKLWCYRFIFHLCCCCCYIRSNMPLFKTIFYEYLPFRCHYRSETSGPKSTIWKGLQRCSQEPVSPLPDGPLTVTCSNTCCSHFQWAIVNVCTIHSGEGNITTKTDYCACLDIFYVSWYNCIVPVFQHVECNTYCKYYFKNWPILKMSSWPSHWLHSIVSDAWLHWLHSFS